MTLIDDSKYILLRILDTGTDYDSALKSFLVTNVRDNKELEAIHDVYELFFDNYYYFENICIKFLSKRTNLLVACIGVVFICTRYFKLTIEEAIDVLNVVFKNNKEKMAPELSEALVLFKDGKIYTFKDISIGTVNHLSILFNLPIWFIQMIVGQYGKETAKKIFLSFRNKVESKFFYNSLVNMDTIDSIDLKEYQLLDDGSYISNTKDLKLVNNSTFIFENKIFKDIFKLLPKANNKYVTLFQSEKSDFYFYFLNEMMHRSNVINIAIKNMNDNPEIIKNVTLKCLSNVFVYKSNEGEMIAHLDKMQDYLFYIAKTTNMQKFYNTPEYRVLLKQKDIDSIIRSEKEGLYELAQRIANKGYLIYIASTIDVKETTLLVNDFICNNDNYKLISEKTLLPTKDDNSLMYFALIQRYDHA